MLCLLGCYYGVEERRGERKDLKVICLPFRVLLWGGGKERRDQGAVCKRCKTYMYK
uniref:Uncharacterized protein n=1 Tax=Triticum urartu TaxID=4572 RepID=A0A8R7P714_TRIUA